MMKTWQPTISANNWFPHLSPSGRYMAHGNQHTYIADLSNPDQPHERDCGSGYRLGWIDDDHVLISDMNLNGSGGLWSLDVRDYSLTEIPLADRSYSAGNTMIASKGHWCTWLGRANNPRWVIDGREVTLPVPAYGIGMDGDWITFADSRNFFPCVMTIDGSYFRQLSGTIDGGGVFDGGIYSFSKSRHNYLNYPDGSNEDVTTPRNRDFFGGEGFALPVMGNGQLWLWTFAWDDVDGCMVIGRPRSDAAVIRLPLEGLYLQVVPTTDGWLIAGCNDKGRATVTRVPYDTPRSPLVLSPRPAPQPAGPEAGDIPPLGTRWIGMYKVEPKVDGVIRDELIPGAAIGNCYVAEAGEPGLKLRRLSDRAIIATCAPGNDSTVWHTPAGTMWPGAYCYVDGPMPTSIDEARSRCRETCDKALANIPVNVPHIMLCQAFDRLTWTDEVVLTALLKVYAEVAAERPGATLLYFSGPARQGGTGDHPCLVPWIRATAAAVAGEPAIDTPVVVPPPPQPPQPPPQPPQPSKHRGGLFWRFIRWVLRVFGQHVEW